VTDHAPLTATVERVALHADPRGLVFEPLAPADIPAQRNVHVVLTEPGAVRGNHLHERGTEVVVVLGPALVRLREEAGVRDVIVPAREAYRLVIPPRVSHAFRAEGDAPMLLVGFNTEPHDPAAPDVVRDLLIAPPG
jgi:UDP-2-acetamido-2,6-beta-L-arabino-hexul-4-ose reductase